MIQSVAPIVIGVLAFVLTFGGALAAMKVRTWLPDHHLCNESKDAVLLATGLIVTMTALLLGFMTTSAMGSFDAVSASVKTTAVDLIALDRLLDAYGPETKDIRETLKLAVADRIQAVWPEGTPARARRKPPEAGRAGELIAARVRLLTPQTADQRWLQSRAATLSDSLLDIQWGIFTGNDSTLLIPFLALLLFWLAVIFVAFGLFAPPNGTVMAALMVCASSVAGAVFLIMELSQPFGGLIRVSPAPMMYAVAHLNP